MVDQLLNCNFGLLILGNHIQFKSKFSEQSSIVMI